MKNQMEMSAPSGSPGVPGTASPAAEEAQQADANAARLQLKKAQNESDELKLREQELERRLKAQHQDEMEDTQQQLEQERLVAQQQTPMEDIQQQLEEARTIANTAKKQCEEYKLRVENLERELRDYGVAKVDMKVRLMSLEANNEERLKLKAEVQGLRGMNEGLLKQFQEKERLVAQHEAAMEDIQQELEEARADAITAKTQCEEYKLRVENLQRQLRLKDQKKFEVEMANVSMEARLVSLKRDKDELKTEVQRLRGENKELKKFQEKESLERRMLKGQSDASSAEETANRDAESTRSSRTQANAAKQQFEELKRRVEKLERELRLNALETYEIRTVLEMDGAAHTSVVIAEVLRLKEENEGLLTTLQEKESLERRMRKGQSDASPAEETAERHAERTRSSRGSRPEANAFGGSNTTLLQEGSPVPPKSQQRNEAEVSMGFHMSEHLRAAFFSLIRNHSSAAGTSEILPDDSDRSFDEARPEDKLRVFKALKVLVERHITELEKERV